jgi:hypothetical protein
MPQSGTILTKGGDAVVCSVYVAAKDCIVK